MLDRALMLAVARKTTQDSDEILRRLGTIIKLCEGSQATLETIKKLQGIASILNPAIRRTPPYFMCYVAALVHCAKLSPVNEFAGLVGGVDPIMVDPILSDFWNDFIDAIKHVGPLLDRYGVSRYHGSPATIAGDYMKRVDIKRVSLRNDNPVHPCVDHGCDLCRANGGYHGDIGCIDKTQ